MFEQFPVLKERQTQTAATLSGGEQQMLTIARALMMKPDLLILDEPMLGVAPVIMEHISKALARLGQSTEMTVLLGEQNVTFALPHADRVYVLEHGRIAWEAIRAASPPKPGRGTFRGGGLRTQISASPGLYLTLLPTRTTPPSGRSLRILSGTCPPAVSLRTCSRIRE